VVCYEAGYDGSGWLARSLAKLGIACRVLDCARIQVNRPGASCQRQKIAIDVVDKTAGITVN
jgi:hypothetical protein